MKKRGFSLLLVILILTAQIPFAFAIPTDKNQKSFMNALIDSGMCGDNLTWTLDDSGTLTISGTGKMEDYSEGMAPWRQSSIAQVTIKSGVTSIGRAAFYYCTNLTKVTIPNSVTSIGDEAFWECNNLTNVTIPSSVTSIGRAAFSNSPSSGHLEIRVDESNPEYSFTNGVLFDKRQTTVLSYPSRHDSGAYVIPDSVTSIGDSAFYYCNLTNIAIPNSVVSIGWRAFFACNLENITIPNSVVSIGNGAFAWCDLKSVTIPGSVSSMGTSVFGNCYALQNVQILRGVTSISDYSFEGDDNLTDIFIPDTVISIGNRAFYECYNLKNVYYGGSQQQWEAINISHTNNYLTSATIHYNSAAPNSEPVAPTPVTPAPQTNSGISKYSYAFANEVGAFNYRGNYRIPLERFQLIFGKTALAKQTCQQAFDDSQFWPGSCYGMDATSAMLAVSGNGVTASAFRSGATRPGELKVSDIHAEWGLTLTEFIEAMQISQYGATFNMARIQNQNQLSSLLSAMSAFENGGGPLIICVFGDDKDGKPAGHALLPYRLDGQRLFVYDCNYPNDGNRYITISDSSWSYTITDGVTWSNSNGGDITYIPYETYFSDWTNRGHVQGSMYVSLVANVADATVHNFYGNEVAVFRNGKMTQGSDTAYPFTPLGITADGISTAPARVAVWLPVDDVYTIINQDASKTSYEVSLCNVNQGVSVRTDAKSVKLEAEDGTQSSSAAIESAGCNYTVTQIYGQNEITFQGKTGLDKFVSSIVKGVSTLRSGFTASTSVTLNGKPIPLEELPNGMTAVSVSRASAQFDDVAPGQYFYDAVMWAVDRGITNGTTATTFSPHNTCTRNHILTFLWRANGSPVASIGNPFTDVDTSKDFGKAAVWAYEKGLVSGKQFNGGALCSRADVVTYLWKLAGRPSAGRNAFQDVPSNADYAQAVSWAVERGITKGSSETMFNPLGICTRGQIVTFLYRAYVER